MFATSAARAWGNAPTISRSRGRCPRRTASFFAIVCVAAWANPSFAGGGGGGHGTAPITVDRDIGPPSESGFRGVKLGDFKIRIYYPSEARKSIVTFKAVARVKEENIAEFRDLFIHRRHKIRDQLIVATRRVPLVDFDEADLTAFRRRILLCLRRIMPELAIEEICVSDFQLDVENM